MKNNNDNNWFWQIFSEVCKLKNVAPSTAVRAMNFSASMVTRWRNGATPFESTIRVIADYFGLEPELFTGTLDGLTYSDPSIREWYEQNWKDMVKQVVERKPLTEEEKAKKEEESVLMHRWTMKDIITEGKRYGRFSNVFDVGIKKVPLLGQIACGQPIYANEEHGEYYAVSEDVDTDFCLQAKGDSMINARILDGDIVFCKYQPTVENGEIAAVIIDDEATLKRFYFDKEKQRITLVPENPRYEPLVYIGSDMASVRVLGKAVAFQSRIK